MTILFVLLCSFFAEGAESIMSASVPKACLRRLMTHSPKVLTQKLHFVTALDDDEGKPDAVLDGGAASMAVTTTTAREKEVRMQGRQESSLSSSLGVFP